MLPAECTALLAPIVWKPGASCKLKDTGTPERVHGKLQVKQGERKEVLELDEAPAAQVVCCRLRDTLRFRGAFVAGRDIPIGRRGESRPEAEQRHHSPQDPGTR